MRKKKICNHDINTSNHTINIFKRKTMVHPDEIRGICQVCHKSFSFTKDDNGIYVIKQEEE